MADFLRPETVKASRIPTRLRPRGFAAVASSPSADQGHLAVLGRVGGQLRPSARFS